jgi:hypothetical protein
MHWVSSVMSSDCSLAENSQRLLEKTASPLSATATASFSHVPFADSQAKHRSLQAALQTTSGAA